MGKGSSLEEIQTQGWRWRNGGWVVPAAIDCYGQEGVGGQLFQEPSFTLERELRVKEATAILFWFSVFELVGESMKRRRLLLLDRARWEARGGQPSPAVGCVSEPAPHPPLPLGLLTPGGIWAELVASLWLL